MDETNIANLFGTFLLVFMIWLCYRGYKYVVLQVRHRCHPTVYVNAGLIDGRPQWYLATSRKYLECLQKRNIFMRDVPVHDRLDRETNYVGYYVHPTYNKHDDRGLHTWDLKSVTRRLVVLSGMHFEDSDAFEEVFATLLKNGVQPIVADFEVWDDGLRDSNAFLREVFRFRPLSQVPTV